MMTGWLILMGLAILAVGALVLAGFPRQLWTLGAAAAMLGAAGYAWQGSPGLAGHPVEAEAKRGDVDPELVDLRERFFGRFNFEYSYFMAADAMARQGKMEQAVAVMLGAVGKAPNNGALWTGLGFAISEHDGGHVSPAAKLAFDKALALWPNHPGPPFFLGLAYVREGNFAEARKYWVRALELTPKDASYRDKIALRVLVLDRFLAEVERRRAAMGQVPPADGAPAQGGAPQPAP